MRWPFVWRTLSGQVAHTVSIWLTLSLAFWRYEVLKNGRHQRRKAGRRCHQVTSLFLARFISSRTSFLLRYVVFIIVSIDFCRLGRGPRSG